MNSRLPIYAANLLLVSSVLEIWVSYDLPRTEAISQIALLSWASHVWKVSELQILYAKRPNVRLRPK